MLRGVGEECYNQCYLAIKEYKNDALYRHFLYYK